MGSVGEQEAFAEQVGVTRPYICLLIILTRLTLRAENPVRGSDQHSCSPSRSTVMITGHRHIIVSFASGRPPENGEIYHPL